MSTLSIQRLEEAAAGWVGTPFVEHSAVRGVGVCCHKLAASIYFDAGWLPRFELPSAPPGWSRAQDRSLMEEWLDSEGLRWFTPMTIEVEREPGDLLGFRIGRCVHHLAIQLSGGRVATALEGVGAVILDAPPKPLAKRLARVWRPRE